MGRILSLMLGLAMMTGALSAVSGVIGSVDGEVPGKYGPFAGGSGTIADPYIIENVWELQNMSLNVQANYSLGNDIDATITTSWNSGAGFLPVGNSTIITNRFRGSLNGYNHTIDGLFINRPSMDNVGLFGYLRALGKVKNLRLVGMNITGNSYVGGLVGYNNGQDINNVHVEGEVVGGGSVGGLMGLNYVGEVTNSSATGEVSGVTSVGGLVGWNWAFGTISCSYAVVDVTGTGDSTGGLVGWNYGGTCFLSDSYAWGKVAGGNNVGGLAGRCSDGSTTSRSYSIGNVTGNNNVGGFVGLNTANVGDCYWDTETSGRATSQGGAGKTTLEMKTQTTFAGWDFPAKWWIKQHVTYPLLAMRTPRAPIRINSNADFDAAHGVVNEATGDGSAGNPWKIENWDINGTGAGYCIYVGNTTEHFMVRNCSLNNANGGSNYPYYYNQGIILANVQNGTLFNNTLWDNRRGIDLDSSNNVLVQGNNASSNTEYGISLSTSSGNNITNNSATYNTLHGIHISSSSDGNMITNNNASHNQKGLYVYASMGNIVKENDVCYNMQYGIMLYSTISDEVNNNTVSWNDDIGIFLHSAQDSIVATNTMLNNGIMIMGDAAAYWYYHTIAVSNTMNGKPVYYLKNQNNITVPAGAGQVIIANCQDIVIEGQNLSGGSCGIELGFSSRVEVANSTLGSNRYSGLYVYSSDYNTIRDNNVTNNFIGMELSSSNVNDVVGNNISLSAYYGISISSGTGNTIYHNSFISNNDQATDFSNNIWNSTYPMGGNYWSDYSGIDAMNGPSQNEPGADGFGDSPYTGIDGGASAQDNYPLMQPWFHDTVMPAAEAGANQTVDEDTVVAFNGSASTDNIGIVNYTWTFIDGGAKTLYKSKPTYTFNTPGAYVVTLNVTDSAGSSDTDTVTITVNDTTAPVANAGSDRTVDEDAPVILDGLNSTDNIGITNYTWELTHNSTAVAIYGVSPQFIFWTPQVYFVKLTVMDAAGNSNNDTVRIMVNDITDPVADAGPDQNVNEGSNVIFDGSGSIDNTVISNYTWSFTYNSTAVVRYGVNPNFMFWTVGTYIVNLIIRDASGHTDTDTMQVTVNDITAPVANAGADALVLQGALVTFDGTGSTDNAAITNYTWNFTYNGSAVVLWGAGPAFHFDIPSVYMITLTVRDAVGLTDTDTMSLTVKDTISPVVDAGPDQIVDEGALVTFDGSASTDNVGIVNWTWVFMHGGIGITLYGVSPVFVFEFPGTYVVELKVTDAALNWATDTMAGRPGTVNITVLDITPPVAGGGANITIGQGTQTYLDGTYSIDNVGVVSYEWTFIYGGSLQTFTTAAPAFTFDIPGVYIATLNVSDAAGNWDTCTLTVTVLDTTWPVADAGTSRQVEAGTLVTFDGSASTDNVGVVNYTWTFSYDGATVNLYGVDPTFRFETLGSYWVDLMVHDAAGGTAQDGVGVDVVDTIPPVANAGPDQSVSAGINVTFDGSASTDTNGTIQRYLWTFTYNGTQTWRDGSNPSFVFRIAGDYTVTLTVTDIGGHTATDTMVVHVAADPSDSDGDGVPNDEDAFPDDPDEWEDTDNDGIGDNEDTDDDTQDSAGGDYTWVVIIIVIIVVVAALLGLIMRRRKPEGSQSEKGHPETEVPEGPEGA